MKGLKVCRRYRKRQSRKQRKKDILKDRKRQTSIKALEKQRPLEFNIDSRTSTNSTQCSFLSFSRPLDLSSFPFSLSLVRSSDGLQPNSDGL